MARKTEKIFSYKKDALVEIGWEMLLTPTWCVINTAIAEMLQSRSNDAGKAMARKDSFTMYAETGPCALWS